MTPRSMTIHINGIAGTPTVYPADAYPSNGYLALGRYAIGPMGSSGTPDTYLDGMLAHVEILPFCLSDLEIARRHAQLSLADLPVAMGPYALPD